MANNSNGEIQLDTDEFRVTKWTIEPGGVIPMHRHEYDYVVVPLVNDPMHVILADGEELTAQLQLGESYSRPAGSEHRVENRGATQIAFIEVERKG